MASQYTPPAKRDQPLPHVQQGSQPPGHEPRTVDLRYDGLDVRRGLEPALRRRHDGHRASLAQASRWMGWSRWFEGGGAQRITVEVDERAAYDCFVMLESIPIEISGPVAVGSVVWSMDTQHRITLIAKTSVGYDRDGRVRAVDAEAIVHDEVAPDGWRCDLAPFLRGTQLTCKGRARDGVTQVSLSLWRAGKPLLRCEVGATEVGSLGPIAATDAEGLARFGRGVVAIVPGTDGRVFSTAPGKQQIGPLRGGETIIVEGFDVEAEYLEIQLPPLVLDFKVNIGPVGVPFDARLDTLAFAPNDRRFTMLWRGSFPVRADSLGSLEVAVALKMERAAAHTGAMPNRSDRQVMPFVEDAEKTPPPLATTLHGVDVTGTVSLGQRIPRGGGTPFRAAEEPPANATALLSRDALKRAEEEDAVPFATGNRGERPAPLPPIPGAPWGSAPTSDVKPPHFGASVTLVGSEEVPEEIPEEGAAEVPAVVAAEPEAPQAKTPEEIERDRPKQAWVSGPELDLEAAKAAPKRAKRKDLNALLYANEKK
jgi:hypothetical protein